MNEQHYRRLHQEQKQLHDANTEVMNPMIPYYNDRRYEIMLYSCLSLDSSKFVLFEKIGLGLNCPDGRRLTRVPSVLKVWISNPGSAKFYTALQTVRHLRK